MEFSISITVKAEMWLFPTMLKLPVRIHSPITIKWIMFVEIQALDKGMI